MINPINSNQESSISQADYLKLFMQELTYQDPLKPLDNREFMAQMAQFSALQEARNSNETLQLLAGMMSGSQSLMLLGKHVKIKEEEKEGLVNKIEFPMQGPPIIHITLNGGIVKKQLNEISEVLN